MNSQGALPYRFITLGVTGLVVKAKPGDAVGLLCKNRHATDERFVKVYDKATAAAETDTPLLTISIKAGETVSLTWPAIQASAGLSLRGTTGVADNDTGAPSSNDLVGALFYR